MQPKTGIYLMCVICLYLVLASRDLDMGSVNRMQQSGLGAWMVTMLKVQDVVGDTAPDAAAFSTLCGQMPDGHVRRTTAWQAMVCYI